MNWTEVFFEFSENIHNTNCEKVWNSSWADIWTQQFIQSKLCSLYIHDIYGKAVKHTPGSSGSSMHSMDGLYPLVMPFMISSLAMYAPPFLMRIPVFK